MGYSYCSIGSTWKLNLSLSNRLIPSRTNIGFWDYSRYSTGKIRTANLNIRDLVIRLPDMRPLQIGKMAKADATSSAG